MRLAECIARQLAATAETRAPNRMARHGAANRERWPEHWDDAIDILMTLGDARSVMRHTPSPILRAEIEWARRRRLTNSLLSRRS